MSSLTPIPELRDHIFSLLVSDTPTKKDRAILSKLSQINKEFKKTTKLILETSKQDTKNELYKKYWKYNNIKKLTGNPQLLDALNTGCELPFVYSSYKQYTPEIGTDIRDIVNLMPKSMDCEMPPDNIHPLFMAVYNKNIPLNDVEFLFEQGMDKRPNLPFDDNHPFHLAIDALNEEDNELKSRKEGILKILKKTNEKICQIVQDTMPFKHLSGAAPIILADIINEYVGAKR